MDYVAKVHRREVHNLDLSGFETGTIPDHLWTYPGARNDDKNSNLPSSAHVPDSHCPPWREQLDLHLFTPINDVNVFLRGASHAGRASRKVFKRSLTVEFR